MKVIVLTPEHIETFEYDEVFYTTEQGLLTVWKTQPEKPQEPLQVGTFKDWQNVRIVEDE